MARKQQYVVEKDKPIPFHPHRGETKYPLAKMKVGDSFFIRDTGTRQCNAYVAATRWADQHRKGWKFTRRYVTENGAAGWRLWRIQ